MLELGILAAVAIGVAAVFVLIKLTAAFVVMLVKVGFGAAKLVLGVLVGVPLLVAGIVLAAVAFPILSLCIPVMLIAGLVALPFVLVFKAVF